MGQTGGWRRRALVACALGALATWGRDARAYELLDDGGLEFDRGALQAESFERFEGIGGIRVLEGSDALHGTHYAVVDTEGTEIRLPLTFGSGLRSIRVRAFARHNRIVAAAVVDYPEGASRPGERAVLFPTGRMTSDGWYEIASAPLTVDSTLAPTVELSLRASGADMDALEVVDAGPGRELRACAVPRDPACAADEYCATGVCHAGDLGVPPLADGDARSRLVEYIEGRLLIFYGGRLTRERNLAAAIETLEAARHATSAWEFWNGFATAIHRLRDWHTKVNAAFGIPGRGALAACFVEGMADRSQAGAPSDPELADVLVSHVGPEGHFSLKPGDRLVAINGVHPIRFVESLDDIDWGSWRANDPEVHAEAVERLRYVIRRWAKTLTFVRCNGGTDSCSAPETVDVSALSSTEPSLYPNCDHRPRYHLGASSPDEQTHRVGIHYGPLAGTQASEGLYGMVWNSVYLRGSSNPYEDAIEALRANAKGVILDHRTGNGGTEPAAEYLTTLFRSPDVIAASTGFLFTLGLFDQGYSTQTGLELFDARKGSRDGFAIGAPTARTTLPVALLLARDGSASDWFPLGMKGAQNVRIFGRKTAGAFSSFISFDYYGGFGFQFGSGDLVQSDGGSRIGVGVEPDEVVVALQSDLMAGRDTMHERALAWLRTCPFGCP